MSGTNNAESFDAKSDDYVQNAHILAAKNGEVARLKSLIKVGTFTVMSQLMFPKPHVNSTDLNFRLPDGMAGIYR